MTKKGKYWYRTTHNWLIRHYGNASQCVKCHEENRKRYEYALIHGLEHDKRRENYVELCVPCHRLYDGVMEALAKRKWKPVCLEKDGVSILFPSIKEALQKLELSMSPAKATAALKGGHITAAGYRWSYKNI